MYNGILFHILATLAYLSLSFSIWKPIIQSKPLSSKQHIAHFCLLATIILHGLAVHLAMLQNGEIQISWSLGLSITLWLGMIIFWVESNFNKINGALLFILPISALFCFLAVIFPSNNNNIAIPSNNLLFTTHILLALAAYALIILAAIQACIMAGLDSYLHRPQRMDKHHTLLNRALDAQPPLLIQEKLLFRLIWVGFLILSIAIITGTIVSADMGNGYFPLEHKTIFTVLSWITFAILLSGRYIKGWRGRFALRWTMIGFAFLVIAYTGTRFIFSQIGS